MHVVIRLVRTVQVLRHDDVCSLSLLGALYGVRSS